MPKSGIKILSDTVGTGPEINKGDRIRLRYSVQFSRGEYLVQDQEHNFTVGYRDSMVAGFRYGIEGMRVGGHRKFKASPHLCYRDLESPDIPKNAVLVFEVTCLELIQ